MTEKLYLPDMPNSPMFEGEMKPMTVEWQEFFRSLFNRVGGIDTVTLEESIIETITESYSTPVDHGKRIDELERILSSLPGPKSYDRIIDDLENKIIALEQAPISRPQDITEFEQPSLLVGPRDWTKITANSATMIVGDDDDAANVSKLQTANDGNVYIVSEDNGVTPGMNLEVAFTGVADFSWVKVLGYYVGNVGHGISIQIEGGAFDDSTWHIFNGMDHHSGSNTFESYDFFVPDVTQYVNSGVVTIRLYHPSNGSPAHDLYLDEVSLYQ